MNMKDVNQKTQIKFKQWLCDIKFGKYSNGRIAMILTNATVEDDGGFKYPPGSMQIAVATVNLPDVDLASDEVCIKNWSENEGVLNILYDAGVIGPVLRLIKTGFVECPVVQLLINPEED